jgi:hypothetical protein
MIDALKEIMTIKCKVEPVRYRTLDIKALALILEDIETLLKKTFVDFKRL